MTQLLAPAPRLVRPPVAPLAAAVARIAGVAPSALRVAYLRRKPGRGLVAVYRDPAGATWVLAAEEAVATGLDEADAAGAGWQRVGEGVWRSAVGLLQEFPSDLGLPGLSGALDPEGGLALRTALDAAARQLTGDPAARAASATAAPVRYKPGDRCVVRYVLHLTSGQSCTVYGKVYRKAEDALAADALLAGLHGAQAADGPAPPIVPRPLGVAEALNLALTADAAAGLGSEGADGAAAVHGGGRRGGGAGLPPSAVLGAAAEALARLHSGPALSAAPRTPADEAAKAAKRAATLAAHVPAAAGKVSAVAARLLARLAQLPSDLRVPSHGSFKPSQLLVGAQGVAVIDFDQYCLADPALDLGYFLAYLRPPGLWYRRSGTRSRFDAAASDFVAAYQQARRLAGADAADVAGALERARVYEAALLFKIACRRANRLQAPRSGEVDALLAEVDALVSTGPAEGR